MVDTAPAGSKLLILSTIGDVSRGATLPAVELQLVDADNKPLAFNGLAIQASCYVPQPCSIHGGQNVTTVDGKVRFDSLKFLQAHDSVRMQFSAAGVPTVTTPNTFKVNNARMDAPRQPDLGHRDKYEHQHEHVYRLRGVLGQCFSARSPCSACRTRSESQLGLKTGH